MPSKPGPHAGVGLAGPLARSTSSHCRGRRWAGNRQLSGPSQQICKSAGLPVLWPNCIGLNIIERESSRNCFNFKTKGMEQHPAPEHKLPTRCPGDLWAAKRVELKVKVATKLKKIFCLKSCKNGKQLLHLYYLLHLLEKKDEQLVHARCWGVVGLLGCSENTWNFEVSPGRLLQTTWEIILHAW